MVFIVVVQVLPQPVLSDFRLLRSGMRGSGISIKIAFPIIFATSFCCRSRNARASLSGRHDLSYRLASAWKWSLSRFASTGIRNRKLHLHHHFDHLNITDVNGQDSAKKRAPPKPAADRWAVPIEYSVRARTVPPPEAWQILQGIPSLSGAFALNTLPRSCSSYREISSRGVRPQCVRPRLFSALSADCL